jgi:hypothetical protein
MFATPFPGLSGEGCPVRSPPVANLFHGLRSGLVGIRALALMRVELLLDGRLPELMGVCGKLGMAVFTNSQDRNISDPLCDPEVALWHAYSFPQA